MSLIRFALAVAVLVLGTGLASAGHLRDRVQERREQRQEARTGGCGQKAGTGLRLKVRTHGTTALGLGLSLGGCAGGNCPLK